MRKTVMVISFIGLAVLITLPMMQFMGSVSKEVGMWGIQIGTALWFLTAPFWMKFN